MHYNDMVTGKISNIEAKNGVSGLYTGNLFGLRITSTNRQGVLKKLEAKMNERALVRPYFVVTINTEMLMISQKDKEFKQAVESADLLVPDTQGLRLLGYNNIYPGRKLVEDLLKLNKYKVFYLGWKQGKQDAARDMSIKYGGLWDEIERQGRPDKILLAKINKYKPDLLLVAFGAPWQEKWIFQNRDLLKAKVIIGIGGAFDYLTGKSKLPPKWVERMGLEWLWRLINDPKRWRRQIRLIEFVWRVLISQ